MNVFISFFFIVSGEGFSFVRGENLPFFFGNLLCPRTYGVEDILILVQIPLASVFALVLALMFV